MQNGTENKVNHQLQGIVLMKCGQVV